MGLPNLVFSGAVTAEQLKGVGIQELKSGLFSLPGSGMIRRFHVSKGVAKAFTRDIIVDALHHNFGTYTIVFDQSPWTKYTRVERVTNNKSERHPHHNNSDDLCWGNLASPRDNALRRGDIETVVGLVIEVLLSFNPYDAYGGWWGGSAATERVCLSCGCDEEHLANVCASCRGDLCEACTVMCRDAQQRSAGRYFCKSCITDLVCTGELCGYLECIHHPLRPEQQSGYTLHCVKSSDGEGTWQAVMDIGVTNATMDSLP